MAVLPVKETDISRKWITKTSVNSVLCRKHTKFDLKKKTKQNKKKVMTTRKRGKQQKHLGVTTFTCSLYMCHCLWAFELLGFSASKHVQM